MAYQAIPPVSSATDPANVALARAKALAGQTLTRPMGTIFDTSALWQSSLASGTANLTTTASGGAIDLASTATGSRSASVFLKGTVAVTSSAVCISNATTTRWYTRFRIKWTTAVDAQANVYVGLSDSGLGFPVIRFGLRGSQATGFYSISTTNNAGVDQVTETTSVAFDTTAFHILETYGDTTNIHFLFDGSEVYSTAVANFGNETVMPFVFCGNGTTAANRACTLTEMWCVTPPTS